MRRKRFTPEQTSGKVREAEVTFAQVRTAARLCRALGLAGPLCRWSGVRARPAWP
jgi:hypothetical protein